MGAGLHFPLELRLGRSFRSAPLLVLLIATAGCGDQGAEQAELDERLAALEEKVKQLEPAQFGGPTLRERVEALEAAKKAPANAPAAAPTAADEDAANQLYGQAKDAAGEGRVAEALALVGRIQSEYPRTRAASRSARTKAELEIVGREAPEVTVEEWYSGSASSLDLDHGTTLLVFWEVWCPHCKKEVPRLQEVHERYEGRLKVVGLTKLTKSATEEKVRQFIAEKGITYPVAKESGAASRGYEVSGVPAAAVVRDGRIVWRGHPARLSDELLESWL